MTKTCSKCKNQLDSINFTFDSQKKDGLRSSCKKCNSKRKVKEILSAEYLRCSKCKKAKLKINFDLDATKSSGHYSSCKDCRRKSYGTVIKKRLPAKTIYVDYGGYKRITQSGGKRQHRLIMENILKRKLDRKEHVHHINGIKTDNRPENLKIVSASEHARHHYLERKINEKTKQFI